MAAHEGEYGRAAKGGLVGGLVGGAALAVFMLIMNITKGQDVWVGFKMAALPFIGDAAMRPGFEAGPVLLGALSHFAVSIAWGIPFGLLAFGLRKPVTMGLAALWGVIAWLGMFYVVLPLVGAGHVAGMMPMGTAIFEHVLFGLGVGIGFLPFQVERPSTTRVRAGRLSTS
jgi:uncharacterized membrane protein YagU involved in acid resistance